SGSPSVHPSDSGAMNTDGGAGTPGADATGGDADGSTLQPEGGGDDVGADTGTGSAYFVEVTALYLGEFVHSVYAGTGKTSDRIAPNAPCTGRQSGACCYTSYAGADAGSVEAAAPPSAGDITVTNRAGDLLTMPPPYSGGDLPWTPGDLL